ncbi:MAG: GFA family protein [Proteobacteria bacterium]|nr:GFA family protein [Pseudomonadota bacterium]
MTQGQCLCGTVRYEVSGPFGSMTHCHCSMCRKHHGAPFATYVSAPLGAFRWICGEDAVAQFKTESGGMRSFCNHCGSVTPIFEHERGMVFIPAGNLDGELGIKPQRHIFVGSKAPWYEIRDALPQHEEWPPGWDMKVTERPAVVPKEGVAQGSCLCGEVAYEVEGKPDLFMLCHCSRCRRGRSAGHGANMFFQPAKFRWIRGESLVKHYKVPEAQRFTVSFCSKCGSGVPRHGAGLPVALVPAATLDTPIDAKPMARIFVASKAPWLDLYDDVPRYDELPPPEVMAAARPTPPR